MAKYGITANSIMPRARTRMTDQGVTGAMFAKPEEGFDTFAPEHVAPLVGYLASPNCANSSGNVYIVWGKSISILSRPGQQAAFESPEAWDFERVDAALTPYFADKQPIADSFIVPPM